MKNITLLLLFLVTLFIINIVFYYNSSYYQSFIKGLRGGDNFVVQNQESGQEQTDIDERIGNIKQGLIEKKQEHTSGTEEEIDLGNIISLEENIEEEVPKNTIKLGKKYLELVDMFSEFRLEELSINTKLFDVTNEYPDQYFEYYSRELTLYIFPTKSYQEVLDIFLVLEDEQPFTINITNNYGEETFYINLNKDIVDNTIRMVIASENRVFGLKIKNNQYTKVQSILQKLPIN